MGDAFQYWTQTAHTKPEAQALATRIGLDIPQGTVHGFHSGLMYPLHRLVTSGEDTPANMAILLGPTWKSAADIHKQCRMYVLMSPPPESSAGVMTGAMNEGSVRWTPRPPNVQEEEALRRQ